MRIGLVTTGFPRFEGDCSGSFVLTVARGMVAQGHRVRVLAPEPRRRSSAPRWPGIEVRWVPYARPRTLQQSFYGSGAPDNLRLRPTRWLGAAAFTAALYRASRRELADCDSLLSSWCIPSGWVASKTAEGRPHLCLCHATDVRWLSKMPGGRSVARDIAEGASAMWFLSEALRDRFLESAEIDSDRIRSHVGPMPIETPRDLDEPRPALRRRLGIEGFTLLFLGRLVPVKGLAELLHAIAAFPRPVSVRIAGDGPDRNELRALARGLRVDAIFEGWVAGERKEALLRACDAIVVPSRPLDGLPTVLFEAQARALPIIATDAPAIPARMRSHPQVELVPANDRDALRQAILRVHDRCAAGPSLRA